MLRPYWAPKNPHGEKLYKHWRSFRQNSTLVSSSAQSIDIPLHEGFQNLPLFWIRTKPEHFQLLHEGKSQSTKFLFWIEQNVSFWQNWNVSFWFHQTKCFDWFEIIGVLWTFPLWRNLKFSGSIQIQSKANLWFWLILYDSIGYKKIKMTNQFEMF